MLQHLPAILVCSLTDVALAALRLFLFRRFHGLDCTEMFSGCVVHLEALFGCETAPANFTLVLRWHRDTLVVGDRDMSF